MSPGSLVFSSDIRARFSAAMSAMYRAEVPAYGTLLELVADINAATLDSDPTLAAELQATDGLERLSAERHGAIRLGTAAELATMRRAFAVMGMYPVGYYDLGVAGIPVHSTAFRPVDPQALAANPFRVFTSLLRLDRIEDENLRAEAESILAARAIFTDDALALLDRAESQGGLADDEADAFVAELLETFRWHARACVQGETYERLSASHRLIADVVSFRGPHINHLTPRTLDIDAAQAAMPERGITAKAVVEGPPPRACPILLRQTSFKALEEAVAFPDGAGGEFAGHHTARFGEIEQRGVALTPAGRARYDELLASARAEIAPAADGSNAEAYMQHLADVFAALPDDWATLRAEGLAYFQYSLTDRGAAEAGRGGATGALDTLIEQGLVRFDPIVYEDFLPVSAAGIFQSNLGDGGGESVAADASREMFEQALGAPVQDEFALYAERETRSMDACLERSPPGTGPHGLMATTSAPDWASIAGADAVFDASLDPSAYEAGARGGHGHAAAVLRPATTEAVSAIVAHCVQAGIPFIAQSGNTGLVGGSTPDDSGGQVVISLERLREPYRLDTDNRSVHVGAGLRLSELNARLEETDLLFPIDLGSDPMLGGMVATNTGGARFLRYGDVRANTLGLTVVLADAEGTVLRLDRALRKDNTAPDWKQLFIGTSGVFGIVTECVLNVEPLPHEHATALLVPSDDAAIFNLLHALETRLGSSLSAFELMSGNAIRHALAHVPSLRNPFSQAEIPPVALMVEISGSRGDNDLAGLLEQTLAEIWEQSDEPLADALFGPPEEIWALRHSLSPGVQQAGHLFAFDLAFTRPQVVAFRTAMQTKLAEEWPELEICDFGHVGDGGLHFNLVCHDPERCVGDDYAERLRDWVFAHAVESFGGSFSGEHGIGRHNQRYYDRYTPDGLKTLADRLGQALGVPASGGARFGH